MKKKRADKYLVPQKIIEIGQKIFELSENKVEYGIGIDKQGNILDPITSNLRKSIFISPEYLNSINGGIFVHNHPESFSLSLQDFVIAHNTKCEIYAKVLNSSQKIPEGFYIIKNADKQDLNKVINLFNKYILLEEIKLLKKVSKNDKIDYSSDFRNIEHKVWKKIKKRTKLEYYWIGI